MVDLVRAGRSPDDLARKFEPLSHSTRAWVAQTDKQEGRQEEAAPGLAAAECDELARLRREVRQLPYKLWEGSWADDAVLRDRGAGIYARPDRVRAASHPGPHHRLHAIHLSEPSPQRAPVL